jgi:hypothetical protein
VKRLSSRPRLQVSWRQRGHSLRVLLAGVAAACLLVSCEDTPSPEGTPEPAAGLEKTVTRGPVSATITVDKKGLSIAERLSLTLQLRAHEDYEVELPAFGEKLEQFGIVDYRTAEPKLVGENEVENGRTYVLEPFLSGEYKIPPMTVRFWKKTDAETVHELETEELTITVASLLPEDKEGLQIADIAGPVAIPRESKVWLWGVGGGSLLLTILVVFLVTHLRGRRREEAEAAIPAHELAFSALERLVADDLIEAGQVELFYVRLSAVLRRYIECRFGLHAPERTTEEFLSELGGAACFGADRPLRPGHQGLLRDFLTHCDLVKFAKHGPTTAEIQQAFDTCKAFIIETAETDD